MPPDVQVVVARYREDASWTAALGLPCLVYDKGGGWPGGLPLPNVGREAHTYLTHILGRYPDFPGHTAFVQADPFAHFEADADPAWLRARIEAACAKGQDFLGLAWFRLRCDGLGRPHQMGDPTKRGRWPGFGKDIPVARVFERLFALPAPRQFVASGVTGNFLVSRGRILARPKGFYRLALNLVEADPKDAENTGHAFERLWSLIFNGNAALNRDDYPCS